MPIAVVATLALRNLRRQLRRSLLTAAAMVFGGIILVFSATIEDGSHEQWIDSGVRLGAGHVTVERPGYRLSRRIDDRLPPAVREAAAAALTAPEVARRVVATSARLRINGLASSAAGSRPADLTAVDPASEPGFGMVDDQIVEGRYLEPGDRLEAVVGGALADSLDLRLGSRFVIQAQDAEGEIAGQLLRVAGIFRSGVPAADQSLVHLPLTTAGEWLGSGDSVTGFSVIVARSADTEPVRDHLERALGDAVASGEAEVLGWRESEPALAAALAIDGIGNILVQGLLFTIIGFGIVNTVLMSVMHRHREFGVLQALGLTPAQTGAVVLIEGLVLTAVSGLAGVALGLGLTWGAFREGLDMTAMMEDIGDMTFSGVLVDPVIVPIFSAPRMAAIAGFIVFMGIVASIYPALRAARIDVAGAMKFDR